MSTPRITLWTDPFRMPFRLVKGTFTDDVRNQAKAIQNAPVQTLEITPGAIYILSCVAGRRMPEPIRWALFDSLRDILNGRVRTLYPERQDILSGTFGEILGAVLLYFQFTSDSVEIIRLLESSSGKKMPDFLFIESTSSGQYIHLLECKGRGEDVHNWNARILNRPKRKKKIDVDLCQEMQKERSGARQQIDQMDTSNMKGTQKITIGRSPLSFGFAYHASTKNVAISSIADGRILWQSDPALGFPTRQECKKTSCRNCIKNKIFPIPDDSGLTNVLSLLYREDVARGSVLDRSLSDFLRQYQTVIRAAWSGHESFFWGSFNTFIQMFYEPLIQDMRETAFFMGMTLLEVAIANELTYIDFKQSIGDVLTRLVSNRSEEDGSVEKDLQKQIDLFIVRQGASRKQIENVPEMPPGGGYVERPERGSGGQFVVPPWTGPVREDRPWYDGDPGLDRLMQFVQEKGKKQHLQIQKTFKEFEDTVYGSAYYEDPRTLRICLASVMKKSDSLKTYIQAIIARFRKSTNRDLDWRDEYFRMDTQPVLQLGQSWDKYPYPNTNNGLPGITAWLSAQGTAEVIIRFLE